MNDEWIDPDGARAQRKAEKAAKARIAQDNAVIQSLMSSVDGRAYVRDWLDICGIFRTIAVDNPYFTYLNEGQRNVGLRLLADVMRACPDAYIQMMKEANDGGRSDPDPDGTDLESDAE